MSRRDIIAVIILALMLGQALFDREGETGPRRPPPEIGREEPRELPWRAPEPGRELPADNLPVVEREGRIVLEARAGEGLSTGTAFPLNSAGLMATAYHVVQGCDTLLMAAVGGGYRVVELVGVHPGADLALIDAGESADPLPFAPAPPRVNAAGFHYGFPGGDPGAAATRLMGRSSLRTSGVRDTREPVLVWALARQWPDSLTTLGGISGSPTLDAAGSIVGVTIAEDQRRGRVYSAAPESLALLRPPDAVDRAERPFITEANWLAVERRLRQGGQVRQVLCATGRRLRIGENVRLMGR